MILLSSSNFISYKYSNFYHHEIDSLFIGFCFCYIFCPHNILANIFNSWIMLIYFIFSSPKYEELKVSFCDHILSAVRPSSSFTRLTLYRLHCILSSWKFIRTFLFIKSWTSSKLGHMESDTRSLGQIEENLVNTKAAFYTWACWNFIRMFVLMICRPSLNMGHVRSRSRSLCQIEGKSC